MGDPGRLHGGNNHKRRAPDRTEISYAFHGDEVSSRHDVVAIGASAAGEAAAEVGGSLGYSVALVERDIVGGTVVTSGGAPTKTFREAAANLSGFEQEKVHGKITGTGQAMETIEDATRVAYNTPTYACGYKLAASAVLTRLHPDAREPCACRPAPTGSEQVAEP